MHPLEKLYIIACRREIWATLKGDKGDGRFLYRMFTATEVEWLQERGFTRGSGWLWYLEDGIYPKVYLAGDAFCCCKGFVEDGCRIVRGQSLSEVYERTKRLLVPDPP